MDKFSSTLEKLTFWTTMWATVNMWWRICPLFILLIIHHPVWHYPPLLVCGPSHTSLMRQVCDLLLAAVTNQLPSRKRSIIHVQIGRILQHGTILKTTSKNSSSYCYCAIMKQMMVCVCVCLWVSALFTADCRLIPHNLHCSTLFLRFWVVFVNENVSYCICSMDFFYSSSALFIFLLNVNELVALVGFYGQLVDLLKFYTKQWSSLVSALRIAAHILDQPIYSCSSGSWRSS